MGVTGLEQLGYRYRFRSYDPGDHLIVSALSYDVKAQVGGKIAQLGGRLINGVAKKYADEFFANFAKALEPEAEPPAA